MFLSHCEEGVKFLRFVWNRLGNFIQRMKRIRCVIAGETWQSHPCVIASVAW